MKCCLFKYHSEVSLIKSHKMGLNIKLVFITRVKHIKIGCFELKIAGL